MKYNKFLFHHIVFGFCCIYLFIFYCQTIGIEYMADLREHIVFSLESTTQATKAYSLLHKLIGWMAFLFSFARTNQLNLYTICMIITLLVSLYITIHIFHSYFRTNYPTANPLLIDFVSLALLTVSMITINPFANNVYLGIGTSNPWHNATYIFCRPFSIMAFIYFMKSFNHAQNKQWHIDYFLLALFAFLSMWAKPSFMISFLPATALLIFYKLIRKAFSLKFALLIGLSFLPSFIPLWIINNNVFQTGESSKVIFTFGEVWFHYAKNIPYAILLALAFPLYILVIRIKDLSLTMSLAALNLLTASAIYFFIAESGDRLYHGNFSWSYLFALGFMFYASCEEFFFKKKVQGIYFKIGWVLFLLHLISGVCYLMRVLLGFHYG